MSQNGSMCMSAIPKYLWSTTQLARYVSAERLVRSVHAACFLQFMLYVVEAWGGAVQILVELVVIETTNQGHQAMGLICGHSACDLLELGLQAVH